MTGGSAVTIASGATFDVENGQTPTRSAPSRQLRQHAHDRLGHPHHHRRHIAGGLTAAAPCKPAAPHHFQRVGQCQLRQRYIVVNSAACSISPAPTLAPLRQHRAQRGTSTSARLRHRHLQHHQSYRHGTSTIDFGSGAVTLNGTGTFSNPAERSPLPIGSTPSITSSPKTGPAHAERPQRAAREYD